MATVKLVDCICNGSVIVTTRADCEQRPGCKPRAALPSPAPQETDLKYIPYILPSGNVVVGTYPCDFKTDKGTPVYRVFREGSDPNHLPLGSDRVVCKLPSGVGILCSRAECKYDGGEVLGRIDESEKIPFDNLGDDILT